MVTFTNSNQAVTTAAFSVEGVYDLTLTISDGRGGNASDTVRITVLAPVRRIFMGVFSGVTAIPNHTIWLDGLDTGILQPDGSFRFDSTSNTTAHTATIIAIPVQNN